MTLHTPRGSWRATWVVPLSESLAPVRGLFERGGKRTRRRSSIRLYTPSQMEALMESAGLTLEFICDGKTGLPFTRGSRRMSAVGRKL